ncbi:MAG: hypothetical protein ACK47Q_01150, partial [Dolichospermum sp.]
MSRYVSPQSANKQRFVSWVSLRFTQPTTLGAELPSPLPEIPGKVNLEDLQKELRSLSKRLQAMEPVNMLA